MTTFFENHGIIFKVPIEYNKVLTGEHWETHNEDGEVINKVFLYITDKNNVIQYEIGLVEDVSKLIEKAQNVINILETLI